MRAVITRVKSASVSIAGSVVGEIGHGLLILLGVGPDDTPELCEKLADKALGLRIFCDEAGKMNRSLADIGGQVLVVSQFPLYADNFPTWSEHTSAMHQLVVWTLLEEAGFGASPQHYYPLIDEAVRQECQLPGNWRLIAQMPFGIPAEAPNEKTFNPIDERIRIFG